MYIHDLYILLYSYLKLTFFSSPSLSTGDLTHVSVFFISVEENDKHVIFLSCYVT